MDKEVPSQSGTSDPHYLWTALSNSTKEFYLLFLEFRDLMSIRSNCFTFRTVEIKPVSFIDKIKEQTIQYAKRPINFILSDDLEA